jgi:hypothetical protein
MKVVSAGVGGALLSASLVLAYLSNNNAEQMIENQNAIVMKYVDDSTKSLQSENISGAIKFAKMAIVADPKNKAGFKAYEKAMELKYKPKDMDEKNQIIEESPVQEVIEAAPDMGC